MKLKDNIHLKWIIGYVDGYDHVHFKVIKSSMDKDQHQHYWEIAPRKWRWIPLYPNNINTYGVDFDEETLDRIWNIIDEIILPD
jgi:hypothetical protein